MLRGAAGTAGPVAVLKSLTSAKEASSVQRPRSSQPKRRPGPHARKPMGSSRVDLDDKTAKAKEREGREESPPTDKEKAFAAHEREQNLTAEDTTGVRRDGRR